jgi:ornithine cyclodeaminase/alanine dehydrogenase-like protein (mu-crystallin family)
MRVLDEYAVRQLLPMNECIDVMAEALSSLARGEVANPLRSMTQPEGGESLMVLMPVHRGGERRLWGLKALAIFPANAARGLDSHQGFVALFDGETGETRALLNAGAITSVRTAAVSAVATRALARHDARVVALIGAGVQAKAHVEAMRAVLPNARLVGWSRTPGRLSGIEEAATAEGAVRDADVVVTATSASTPVVAREWLRDGVHINAVGSAFPNARELDTATVRDSAYFVDSRVSAFAEAGDFLIPLGEGAISEDHIRAELGDVLIGSADGRRDDDEITVFESLGLAVEDLVAAEYVLARAEAENVGTLVSL